MKLTVKQRKFADNYIETGNAKQSAIDAGYAKRSAQQIGAENLLKPVIKSYITKKLKEIESAKIMDATEAIELLTSIARGEETETVYIPTITGDVVEEEKPADLKTKITAIREILKRYPSSDKVRDAQARKLLAEAEITEARAKDVKEGSDGQMNVLTNLLDELKDGVSDGD